MSEYNPDCWVIIEFGGEAVEGGPIKKVLGGWYGGYLYGDSWRASSGIEKIIDGGDHWVVHNYSGSIYRCHKGAERMSGAMLEAYAGFAQQAGSRPEGQLTIRYVPIDEIPIG